MNFSLKIKFAWELVIYYALFSFLVNGPLELSIPYLMSITRSESFSGIILTINMLIGAGVFWVTLGVCLLPAVRRLEDHVPDYDVIRAHAAGD